MPEMMDLEELLANYEDGDGVGWAAEMEFLRTQHAPQIARLTWEIKQADGIEEPIQLGYDGRVWDGHHRLAVAQALGFEEVPVDIVSPPPQKTTSVDDNEMVQMLRGVSERAGWERARKSIRSMLVNEIQKLDAEFRETKMPSSERSAVRRTLSVLVTRIEELES